MVIASSHRIYFGQFDNSVIALKNLFIYAIYLFLELHWRIYKYALNNLFILLFF